MKPGTNKLRRRKYRRKRIKAERKAHVATYYPPGDRRRVTREQALQCIIPASEFCIEPAKPAKAAPI